MAVKVFLSSTSEDLEQDIRPEAIDSIQKGGGMAICMENFIVPNVRILPEIKKIILKKSTHYLGIFAFRRGWVPPEQEEPKKSITEMEYECAFENMDESKRIIFLPVRTSPYIKDLKLRAEQSQSPEEKEAQDSFRERVSSSGHLYTLFKSLGDLCNKILLMVQEWSGKGLRKIERKEIDKPPYNSKRPLITENDILNLLKTGQEKQLRQFKNSLNKIFDLEVPCAVGFLVYGKTDFRHSEMIDRLCSKVEANSRVVVRRYDFSIGVPSLDRSITSMIQSIGERIQVNQEEPSIIPLASRLKELLADSDVVLTINNLQRLDDSVNEFQERFWQPLVKELGEGFKTRFIALFGLENAEEKKNQLKLCDPSNSDDFKDCIINGHIIALDELKKIEQIDLSVWLGKWFPRDEAKRRSKTYIAESRGGVPESLYYKLRKELIDTGR